MSFFGTASRFWLVIFTALLIVTPRLQAQAIDLERKVTAGSGWTPWYELHVDPENANNMILCGSKWNAKDNASYGFVYSSSDAGNTWRQAMEDKNTVWVTEQSCAYGTHGVAYYMAAASKIIGQELHHELGTTRIYTSHDNGKNWKLGIETGWTDYSASVVDTAPGPNQNRLYAFFNNLATFQNSIGKTDAAKAERTFGEGTRVGMISYKDGDSQVAGPFSSEAMFAEKYRGSYPAPTLRLKDGSIVSFYTSKRRNKDDIREFLAEMVRLDPTRTSLEAPVHVATSVERADEKLRVECGGLYLGSAAAYDADHDELYYVYSDVQNNQCQLFITTSTDGGRTWSKTQAMSSPDDADGRLYADPAIAVNKDGVLAVMWQEKFRSGCWRFAVSADGKSLSRSRELGGCTAESSKPSALSNPYLWSSFFQADPKRKADTARINLRNTRGSVWRNQHALATSPNGTFHAVWLDTGTDGGGIQTASIRVMPPDKMISSATKGLQEVTETAAVLYGGNQSYDAKSGILTLNAAVRNKGDKPLNGPFKLAVPAVNDHHGLAEIANAENKATGAGAVWDVSQSVPNGTLAPGATSKPFSLQFKYLADPHLTRDSDDIFGINVKVFAKLPESNTGEVDSSDGASKKQDVAHFVGKEAVQFTLATMSGKQVSLSDYKGKAVLLNFWATWCEACRQEMPWLAELREKYAAQGFEVLGILTDKASPEKIASAVKASGARYPVLFCNHEVAQAYGGLPELPVSFFIDRQGKIVAEMTGPDSKEEIETKIKQVLSN